MKIKLDPDSLRAMLIKHLSERKEITLKDLTDRIPHASTYDVRKILNILSKEGLVLKPDHSGGKYIWLGSAKTILPSSRSDKYDDERKSRIPSGIIYEDWNGVLEDLKKMWERGIFSLLIGEKGTGKTQCVMKMAQDLQNLSLRTREHHLIGRLTMSGGENGNGKDIRDVFKPGPVIESMECGGLLYLDELNCISPDTMINIGDAYIAAGDIHVGENIGLGRVDKVFKPRNPILLELKTNDGRSINATPGHRFLTPSGWKRAGQLKIGEKVYCLRKANYRKEMVSSLLQKILIGTPATTAHGYPGSASQTQRAHEAGILQHDTRAQGIAEKACLHGRKGGITSISRSINTISEVGEGTGIALSTDKEAMARSGLQKKGLRKAKEKCPGKRRKKNARYVQVPNDLSQREAGGRSDIINELAVQVRGGWEVLADCSLWTHQMPGLVQRRDGISNSIGWDQAERQACRGRSGLYGSGMQLTPDQELRVRGYGVGREQDNEVLELCEIADIKLHIGDFDVVDFSVTPLRCYITAANQTYW